MKIKVEKQNLMEAVNIVSKAVPSKTTMSILQCILIDASTESVRLIGNDTELGIQTEVDGIIEEHGIIAVDAAIFSNIVRKLPDGTVLINAENERVMIRCEQAKFNILGRDGTDFTYLPEIEREYAISVSQFTLRDIISKTIFSISGNDSNKMMTGELFEINENTLRVVALDGHRISIRKVELRESYGNKKVIIPGKTLSEISKIISGDMEKMVNIYFSDKHALFEFDNTLVASRLIEGEYFNIDQMLSNDYSTHIRINRQELLSCLDRATLLVKEEDKKPIILLIRDETVELKINTTIGSMDEVIAIDKSGDDLNIGFNPKFLIDALRSIDEEAVDIYLLSSRAPAFVRDEGTYCYLILPVNFINID
ncbi:MAG: DNA polymerase III subunit beta [Lachnospiraceae bacterium]|nr:DNA polymerase III subunit beta [Lachnospiraceae bacterium]